jgi:branched-chain amino acid transport system ATP-binding protein
VSLLEARGLTVRFGGHMAVNDVDLDVAAGSVTGLIGPNGAGKTTIFNALCGLQDLAAGKVTLDGHDITRLPTHQRARRGLARTFQRLELFGSLTVRENLQVAAEYRSHLNPGGTAAEDQVAETIEFVGLAGVADTQADLLSTGQARLVELGRALVTKPHVLLLDEPASGLDVHETGAFVDMLAAIAASGVGVLLVEHDMDVVMGACGSIHVIDFGRLLAVGTPDQVRSDQAVLDAYLGSPAGIEP